LIVYCVDTPTCWKYPNSNGGEMGICIIFRVSFDDHPIPDNQRSGFQNQSVHTSSCWFMALV